MALQLAENPYAAPPEGPRIPRHRNPKDGRPWIRNVDDPDPAPGIEWDPDRRIWALAKGNRHRGRGEFLTRASSFGKGLQDYYQIQRARERRIMWAVGRRPEIVRACQAAASRGYDECDRAELEELARRAHDYAGGDAAAWLGTTFHDLREQRDAGVDLSYLDPVTLAGLAMWCRITEPLELVSSEQFVVNYALGAAGTYDAMGRLRRTVVIRGKDGAPVGYVERGEHVIVDLKSGRWGMDYAGPTWACQALVYAGGQPYDHDGGWQHWPHDAPSQRWAVIVACNPERASEAGLHWVDLEAARARAEAVPVHKAGCSRDGLFYAHDETAQDDQQSAGATAIQAGIALEIDRASSLPDLLVLLQRRHASLWTDELTARCWARATELAPEALAFLPG